MPRNHRIEGKDLRCPICEAPAVQVTGEEVYPHRPDLYSKKFWECPEHHARVGCHDDGRPFGWLATTATRSARMKAHEWFDVIWKVGNLRRSEAYEWLAGELGI